MGRGIITESWRWRRWGDWEEWGDSVGASNVVVRGFDWIILEVVLTLLLKIRTSFQQIPNAKQQNHEESFKTSSFHASTSMFTLEVLPALALFVKVPSRVGSLLAKAREVDVSANSMLERDLTGVLPAIDPLKVKVYLSVVPSPKKNIFNWKIRPV